MTQCAHCPLANYPRVPCVSERPDGHRICHLVDPAAPQFHACARDAVRKQSLQLAGLWVEPDPPPEPAHDLGRARLGLLASEAGKRCPYGDPFRRDGCKRCRWCYSRGVKVYDTDCTACAGYGTL